MTTHSDEDSIRIIQAADERRKRAATKALDVSLNELADMYHGKELIIRPEFQRLFRWSDIKQSQFIESLILEMPVPPIFVIEIEEGKWELIDGLQRISSYLHFRGFLSAPEHVPPIASGDMLQLTGCDIVPELNKVTFEDLPTALQIRLKRSFIRVEQVRKETDNHFRYYMFKRLNTGGEPLSEQEVRNCTIRLLGDRFNNLLLELSHDAAFLECIKPLTDEKRRQMGDIELVLRYFAFKNNFDEFTHDIGPFLTDYMERVTDERSLQRLPFDYFAEAATFKKVFQLLQKCLGENTCLRYGPTDFGGQFSIHHYEAFSLGVAKVVDQVDFTSSVQLAKIKVALLAVKKDDTFKSIAKGGGQNSPGLYKKKIDFVTQALKQAL
jgi:hypothetical protein